MFCDKALNLIEGMGHKRGSVTKNHCLVDIHHRTRKSHADQERLGNGAREDLFSTIKGSFHLQANDLFLHIIRMPGKYIQDKL